MGSYPPGGIHLYDLEIGTTAAKAAAFPFASVTVPAPANPDPSLGTGAVATIDELLPGTDYFFKVRAHCGASGIVGCTGGDAQMIAGWSNFSQIVPCSTAPKGSAAVASAPPASPLVETFWVEAFRVSENMVSWPDFLADHNSGDLQGDVAFLTNSGGGPGSVGHFFDFDNSPRVRYCVEVQKVDLSAISRTPSGPPFISQNQT